MNPEKAGSTQKKKRKIFISRDNFSLSLSLKLKEVRSDLHAFCSNLYVKPLSEPCINSTALQNYVIQPYTRLHSALCKWHLHLNHSGCVFAGPCRAPAQQLPRATMTAAIYTVLTLSVALESAKSALNELKERCKPSFLYVQDS